MALQAVLEQRRLSPVRAELTFHAMTADAQIAVYDAQYIRLRRGPVMAIRSGGASDAGWKPLVDRSRRR